ncbi:MAG TPA: T9SS type A sorting domain-containing protein [Chitinophagales bacterium]|nr:T9SS type A sorting domain-containing protein [Chitinophagales bacterium]
MKKKSALLIFLSLISFKLFSQTPDWSTTVASIFYNNCTVCHHSGAIAPFELMTYNDAVDQAFSIQADVNARKMPPWPPDPNYNHLWHERVLSDDDINSINEWVDGGMPEGDTTLAPMPPVYNGNSLMVNADDTIVLPAFTVPQQTLDVYRTFVVHSDFTDTTYLNQIEFLPGNPAIVHHVFIFYDTSNVSWIADSLSPGPGLSGGGQGGFSPYSVYFCGWTPGSSMLELPPNMGFMIPPGSDFAVEIHYSPGSTGQTDSTRIKLKFTDPSIQNIRPVYAERLLYWHTPSLIDGPFAIPPTYIRTFHEKSDSFTVDKSLLQLQPHSHLICVSWKVFLVTTPGDTTNLVYIPSWNFNWQMGYFLTKLVKLPVNSQLWGEAVFDNTTNNPNNPSNPPVLVTAGETTLDEMMACRFSMLDYQAGDENYILDSAFYGLQTGTPVSFFDLPLQVFPNPANDVLNFTTSLPAHNLNWEVMNGMGIVMKSSFETNVWKGAYAKQIDVSDLPSGIYFLKIQSRDQRAVRKISVVR